MQFTLVNGYMVYTKMNERKGNIQIPRNVFKLAINAYIF